MNCQNFESIITDLTRDQIIEATVRQAAIDHAEHCAVCGRRFADENTLTAALRDVAMETQVCKPSANLEEALLKAFRESTINFTGCAANANDSSINQRYLKYVGVAAAIVVVILTLVALSLHTNNQGSVAKTGGDTNSPPVSPKDSPKRIEQGTEPGQYTSPARIETVGNQRPQRPVHRASKNTTPIAGGAADQDVTGQFIALPTAGSLAPLESGQIVRVEVMRSSLIAIGMPMNAQRAGESIKADLLVGQDGLPRAIRFVQ